MGYYCCMEIADDYFKDYVKSLYHQIMEVYPFYFENINIKQHFDKTFLTNYNLENIEKLDNTKYTEKHLDIKIYRTKLIETFLNNDYNKSKNYNLEEFRRRLFQKCK